MSINAITCDQQGVVIIGTNRGGLMAFDGQELAKSYLEETNFSGTGISINAVDIDSKGRIWALTNKVVIIDGDTQKWYSNENSQIPGNTGGRNLVLDQQDRAWITFGWVDLKGVYVLDGESVIHYSPANSGLVGDRVHAITFDGNGNAWLGTGQGVSMFDGDTWTNYTSETTKLLDLGVSALAIDSKDQVWVVSGGSLIKFDGNSWEIMTNGLPEVTVIEVDLEGNVWIGTITSGLYIYDGKKLNTYDDVNSNIDSWITDIAFDRQGNGWVGTAEGIFIIPPF